MKVVKLTNKGKKVVVKDILQSPAELLISAEDFPLIDEAIFKLTDASDGTPEHDMVIVRGHKSPSDNPHIKDGYLTPVKETREFKKGSCTDRGRSVK